MQHARRQSAAPTWPVKIRSRPATSLNQRCKRMVNSFQTEACHIRMAVALVYSIASSAAAARWVKIVHAVSLCTSRITSSAVGNGKRNSATGEVWLEKTHGKNSVPHSMLHCSQRQSKRAQFTTMIDTMVLSQQPMTQTTKIRHCSSSSINKNSSNSSKRMLQCCPQCSSIRFPWSLPMRIRQMLHSFRRWRTCSSCKKTGAIFQWNASSCT